MYKQTMYNWMLNTPVRKDDHFQAAQQPRPSGALGVWEPLSPSQRPHPNLAGLAPGQSSTWSASSLRVRPAKEQPAAVEPP